jgi:hypothetical protein
MRKWLILLSALLAISASGAPAWTWVDAKGTVHFSDTPVPGAKQIQLAGAQGFGAAARAQSSETTTSNAAPATAIPQQPASYRTFNITSPTEQETLWNIGGTLTIQVALEPRLQSGHRLDAYLDGERRNLNATSLSLSVRDVFRGTHTVQVAIVDQSGSEILRSSAVTFMVQQTSTQNPNAPLAPRPRPRPNGGN